VGEAEISPLAQLKEAIERSEHLVVLTGAGVSTDSGIPDFRGPSGLWTRNPEAEKLSHIHYYLTDEEVRKAAWRARASSEIFSAVPNDAHRFLAWLEEKGKLKALITQNIDRLHQKAGSRNVLELHGNALEARCLSCGEISDIAPVLARVRAGDEDPRCQRMLESEGGLRPCNGILKSNTVSFGEPLEEAVIDRAFFLARSSDVFVAMGTSLTVTPAAYLVDEAKAVGAFVAILNASPTPYDEVADVVVRAPLREVVRGLMSLMGDAREHRGG
jgi:NAD-dependent deacetylase